MTIVPIATDERHVDNLKNAVTSLRQALIEGCSAELYKKLDEIMYALEDIIDELQPDDE